MNGADVESLLRTDDVDRASSVVSTIVEVRHLVNQQLRRVAGKVNIVAEGRDMTTVVFPDAEVKIYLDADPGVRARRRFVQGTSTMSLAELEQTIKERDHRDRNKVEGSLKISDEAVVLDTSTLTLDKVCEKVSGLIKTCL
jgi:cytidylate kinase